WGLVRAGDASRQAWPLLVAFEPPSAARPAPTSLWLGSRCDCVARPPPALFAPVQDGGPLVSLRVQPALDPARVGTLATAMLQTLRIRADRMFAILLAAEWLGLVATALWVAPRTWIGTTSSVHPHVWIAVLLGGAIVFPALLHTWKRPGTPRTRQ